VPPAHPKKPQRSEILETLAAAVLFRIDFSAAHPFAYGKCLRPITPLTKIGGQNYQTDGIASGQPARRPGPLIGASLLLTPRRHGC
jgi:hypothetical protein